MRHTSAKQREQTAAEQISKGRIAAATYRITLAHAGYFLYFTMSWEMPPKLTTSPRDPVPT